MMIEQFATPPSSPEPEALIKDKELFSRLEEMDRARKTKRWFDPLIVLVAFLFVLFFRFYAFSLSFYFVHLWPIKYYLSSILLFKGRRRPVEEYSKIPKHVAIYTSAGYPQKINLNRLVKKCLEYQIDEQRTLSFLTIIIDNDIDWKEYIQYDPDEKIELFYNYEPVCPTKENNALLKVNIVRKDGCQRVSQILQTTTPRPTDAQTMLALISPIFPVIDLILVLHPQLILQGCMPFHISFSEIKHYPCPRSDFFLGMLEQAIFDYSQCKQNFGK